MAARGGRAALVFYAATLTVAAVVLAQRLASATLLTAPEVIAYGHKLDRLRAATRVQGEDPRDQVQVTWTLASRCGDYRALALLAQWRQTTDDGQAETHLAARLDVERGGLPPRDPRRPVRAVLRLQRDDLASDLASDLATAEAHRRLSLRLELPARAPGVAPPPVLRVDNSGAPLASGMNAAFAFAHVPHCKASAADVRTLGTLARLLRARFCRATRAPERGCVDAAILLYPDVHARRYRIDVAPLAGDHGRLRLRLVVEGVGAGLRRGVLEPLAESDLDLAAHLYWVPPRPPGEYLRGGDPGLAALAWDPHTRRLEGTRDLDFATLLASGGGAPGPAGH
jgi:hypothetical protein